MTVYLCTADSRVFGVDIAAVERCFNFGCGSCNIDVALGVIGCQFAVECSDEVNRTRISADDSIALCAFRRAYFCTTDSRVFGVDIAAVERCFNFGCGSCNIDVALGVLGCQFAAESAYVNRTGIVVYYDISSSRYRNIPNRCGGFRVGNIEIAAVERCFNFSCGTCNVNVALGVLGCQFAVECSDEVYRTRISADDSIALCAFRRAYFCTTDSRVFGVDIAAVERCFNFGCGSCNIDVALGVIGCQFAVECSDEVNRTRISADDSIALCAFRRAYFCTTDSRVFGVDIAAVERCFNFGCGSCNIDVALGVIGCQFAVNCGNVNLAGVGING